MNKIGMVFRVNKIQKREREKLRELDRLTNEQAKKELTLLHQFIFKGKPNEKLYWYENHSSQTDMLAEDWYIV